MFFRWVFRMNFSGRCTHDFIDQLCLTFDQFCVISDHFFHSHFIFDQLFVSFDQLCALIFRTVVLMTFSITSTWYPITCFIRSVVFLTSSFVLDIRSVVGINISNSFTHDFFDHICLISDHFFHSTICMFHFISRTWYSNSWSFPSISCTYDIFDQFSLIFD